MLASFLGFFTDAEISESYYLGVGERFLLVGLLVSTVLIIVPRSSKDRLLMTNIIGFPACGCLLYVIVVQILSRGVAFEAPLNYYLGPGTRISFWMGLKYQYIICLFFGNVAWMLFGVGFSQFMAWQWNLQRSFLCFVFILSALFAKISIMYVYLCGWGLPSVSNAHGW